MIEKRALIVTKQVRFMIGRYNNDYEAGTPHTMEALSSKIMFYKS